MLALSETTPFLSRPVKMLPPPLKWAGGKRWLVPELQRIWLKHSSSRLVEPFVGGMAIYLGIQPHRALLSDANPHLINFYRWLRRGLQITIPLSNDSSTYYMHRDRFNELITLEKNDSKESAMLFYYLNRTGFNGLCRFNKQGLYNVPFGKYKTINYTTNFREYSHVLKGISIKPGDFSEIRRFKNDFIYADPPYDVEFTSYSAGGFSWADQIRLVDWLATHEGPVVASNQATQRVIELYRSRGFSVREIEAPRRISSSGDRTPATEILALKGV